MGFQPDTLAAVLHHTSCYPYFLQEWGKDCWDCAAASPVTTADVEAASLQATAELDASFFRARFDRLTLSKNATSEPWSNSATAAPFGRNRQGTRPIGSRRGPGTSKADRQGHDLQPCPRRHSIYSTPVRRLPEAHHPVSDEWTMMRLIISHLMVWLAP